MLRATAAAARLAPPGPTASNRLLEKPSPGKSPQGRVRRGFRQGPRAPARPWLAALATGCALVAALLGPAPGAAHELRPLIATVEPGPDALRLELSMNLEAAIAGIGPEHDDTAESPRAAEYDRLRGLPPAELEERFGAFAPRLIDGIALGLDGRPARLGLRGIEIPEPGTPASRGSRPSRSRRPRRVPRA